MLPRAAEFVFQFQISNISSDSLTSLFPFFSILFTEVLWTIKEVDQVRTRAELSGLVTDPSAETDGVIDLLLKPGSDPRETYRLPRPNGVACVLLFCRLDDQYPLLNKVLVDD